MTDLAIDAPTPEAPPSTVIDTDTASSPSGGGVPRTLAEPEDKTSLRDTIAAVVKEDTAKAEKPEKVEAKEEPKKETLKPVEGKARDQTGKFTETPKAPADTEQEAATDHPPGEPEAGAGQDKTATERQSEGRKYPEPPARFLPDSKEVWKNTPRSVQRDINIELRRHEEEIAKTREVVERYEAVRQYDEIARSNGRELKESLAKVAEIEDALAANPIAGLNKVLMEIGPRKADGQPVSLFEVAQYIVQQGQGGYQQIVQQAQRQQTPQENPQVVQLQRQLQEMQGQMTASQVIEPFAREHPRYYELQDDIALFLKSGKIANHLSPAEKLEAAYVMAERINPPSRDPAPTTPDLEPDARAANSFNGTKSIKSAPGAVDGDIEPDRGGSIRDLLTDELRRMKRS